MKKLVPKKTRKAIHKSVRKIIKKHGPELVAAVAAGALGDKVSDALASDGKKSHKQSRSALKAGKKRPRTAERRLSRPRRRSRNEARHRSARRPGGSARSKDATLRFAVRAWLNRRLRGIGEMTDLSIDTKRQTVRAELQLSGEAEPIEIHVRKYALRSKGDRAMLTIIDATASRRWVAAVLRKFVSGQTFPIPSQAATALKLLT